MTYCPFIGLILSEKAAEEVHLAVNNALCKAGDDLERRHCGAGHGLGGVLNNDPAHCRRKALRNLFHAADKLYSVSVHK